MLSVSGGTSQLIFCLWSKNVIFNFFFNTNVRLTRQTSLKRWLDLTIPLSWSQSNLSRRTAEVNSVDLRVNTGNTKASGLSRGQPSSVPWGLKMEQRFSSFSWPSECKRAWFPEDLWLTFLRRSRQATSPRDDSLTRQSQVVRITVHWVLAVTFQRLAKWTEILFLLCDWTRREGGLDVLTKD